jgi:hypothetical protein
MSDGGRRTLIVLMLTGFFLLCWLLAPNTAPSRRSARPERAPAYLGGRRRRRRLIRSQSTEKNSRRPRIGSARGLDSATCPPSPSPTGRSIVQAGGDLEASLLERPTELCAEPLRLLGCLPSGRLEQVQAPAGGEPSPDDVQRLSRLVECRDVDRKGLVVDLVPEIGLLEAGRDEPCLIPRGLGSVSEPPRSSSGSGRPP